MRMSCCGYFVSGCPVTTPQHYLCHAHPDRWAEALPLVLLGIRTSLKEDIGCTAAELVYGCTLRLPGEFFSATSDSCPDPGSYVSQLKSAMRSLHAAPTRQPTQNVTDTSSSLARSSHVFVRHDAVKKPQPMNTSTRSCSGGGRLSDSWLYR